MNKVLDLPSGAKLEIYPAPFADARQLYLAVAEEVKDLKISSIDQVENCIKDLFCTALTSKKIEAALAKCMLRVTYNGVKITDDTFEPVDARQDYLMIQFEVARENIYPFMKSLFAQYKDTFLKLKSALA